MDRRLLLCLVSPALCIAGDYVYSIREGGYAIRNGPAYFNRPLFGTHEPSLLLSGDRPAYAYIAPQGMGKIGTLYIGLTSARGGKWLHMFHRIDSIYQPGLTRHTVEDEIAPGGSLEVTVVPLATNEGFAVRLHWLHRPANAVRLIWAFGGASGYQAGYELRLDQLHFTEEGVNHNVLRILDASFSLTSPSMQNRVIEGTCDVPGRLASAAVRTVLLGPSAIDAASGSQLPVAVFSGDWLREQTDAHLIFTMNGSDRLAELARHPMETVEQSVRYYRTLAHRVRVDTPDRHFDLAFEAMVIANDGLWQPPIFLHGALSWMRDYLGWRGWYGSEALGFHDRVRTAIEAFAAQQLQRGDERGGIPDRLGSKRVGFNMNEVFLDQVYYHYLWTGDREWLASLFRVIQGVLSWEKRRLDPDDNALYESGLNTWISDSHWYSGGDTTQASAYMYRAHCLAAEAAEAAGSDPEPFRREAQRIRKAVNEKLWVAPKGHYAEFIDRIGLRRIHLEPELPTLYHSIEFGVADQLQAYQALRFTETNLRNETNIPNGGRLVWSSNWAPNNDRRYTHSTYDLAFAEALNLAIAYYRAGQFDKAYELVKGVYASMYQGGIPGGLSGHARTDGRQRADEEFGDAISMFARTAVEGLFGILPEFQNNLLHITPGLPSEWHTAAIETPDVSYRFRKSETEIALDCTTARAVRIHYRVPVGDARVVDVLLDGRRTNGELQPGIMHPYLDVTGPPATASSLRVRLEARPRRVNYPVVGVPGENWTLRANGAAVAEIRDPQMVLTRPKVEGDAVSGTVTAEQGWHTLFVLLCDGDATYWEPVNVKIRPAIEILDAKLDAANGQCRFRLRNNAAHGTSLRTRVSWAGLTSDLVAEIPFDGEKEFTVAGDVGALEPGANTLRVGDASYTMYSWEESRPSQRHRRYHPVPLDGLYNDTFGTILSKSFWSTEYPYPITFDDMMSHVAGERDHPPDDSLLRAAIDASGILMTRYGIPFRQRRQGKNLMAVSRWQEFPQRVEIPIGQAARKIYLMLSAITFPMQSQIANAHVTVYYADGGTSEMDLVNPETLDNGWGRFGGTNHTTSFGNMLLGQTESRGSSARSLTILSQSLPPGDAAQQLETPEERPHADIVDLDCAPNRQIERLSIEALSNEIILAVFGVTLLE